MIDIEKVRKWSVRFSSFPELQALPFPSIVVEEVEGTGYHLPQCNPKNIPPEIGGQITVTLDGHGIFRVGREHHDCLPGTAFCYRDCDPLVSYYTANNSSWHFLWINFCGLTSERLIAEVNRSYGYFFHIGKNSGLEQKLLDYKRYSGSSLRLSPWEGAKIVLEFLEMLCGQANMDMKITSSSRLVNEVKDEIRKSFNESLTVELLARKNSVSREHLSKTFHQETGMSLRDYLAEQRLNEALSLLLKSNLSCKEIATICRYGSYSAFFRCFRKVYGVSPDEFRRTKLG
ncbi:MAG: helix-turn-helix transcriptional regulator [Victivallales bacterium]|nr:helix-turn-helix transcriptional regulator [Victivallales bacterium]